MQIAQLIPGIDDIVLLIIAVLTIVIIAAALLLRKARGARSAKAGRLRTPGVPSQPAGESVPAATWVPKLKLARIPEPVPAPFPDADFLENCTDLQQSLHALAGKYSLNSFTIATSDGLVFASSGGETAQADAARYSRHDAGTDPGLTLFVLNHKGSELTGIIRSSAGISPGIRKRIENDTKDILNRWI